MIKYRTGRYWVEIDPVEVLRETPKTVIITDKWGQHTRSRKDYHDTWEEARDHLRAAAEAEVFQARRQLELANSKLGNVIGLKKPGDSPSPNPLQPA